MTTRVRADMSRDHVDALVTDRYLDSLLAAAQLVLAAVAARFDFALTYEHGLIGGVAITSAAISIVGVAWVAWRAAHPAAHPADGTITRIARSDHVRRVAAAMSAGGLGGPA